MDQLYIGLVAEGPTDQRFFTPILERLTQEMLIDLGKSIQVTIREIRKSNGDFPTLVIRAVEEAQNNQFHLLLIHLDADASDITDALQHKVEPANAALARIEAYLAPVYLIPVQETEAWLLADLPKLRRNLRTNLSNQNLGWTFRNPELLADPKKSIKEAIDLINQGRRRNQTVDLAKLYGPLGSSIDLNELIKLSSFQKFKTDYQRALENILR